jgi:putative flippase GtrA
MNPIALVRNHLQGPADDRAFAQLVRYGVVASLGYLFAVVVYALQLAIGVPAYPAVAVVFVLNGLFNFVGVRLWAFPPSGKQAHHDLGRFVVVAAGSLVINYTAFYLLFSVADLPALLAQAVAIAVAAPFGFVANRLWSFRSR